MPLEVTSCCAGIVTLSAAKRFFSRMCLHVLFEVATCCAREVVFCFSPEWVSLCVSSLPAVVQEKLHSVQPKDFFFLYKSEATVDSISHCAGNISYKQGQGVK